MGTDALKTRSAAAILVRWYAILIAVLCFGWPLLLGIRAGTVRWIWAIVACGLVMLSIAAAYRAAKHAGAVAVSPQRAPWIFFLLIAALVCLAAMFPVTFFSDEADIALPALNILSRVAHAVSWPGVCALTLLAGGFLIWFRAKLRDTHVWIIVSLLVCWSLVLLLFGWHANTVFVRYPPLVHLMQMLGTAIGMGSSDLMRLPNAFWTLLLFGSAWYLTPRWHPAARIAMAAAACLTPLGWTYRILLYQACGEVTLGIAAIFLLTQIVRREDGDALGLYSGMLFGIWILYRPTIIAVVCATVLALWILKRPRAARDISFIALPLGVLWMSVYVFGAFQYDFLSGSSDRHFVFITPVVDTLTAMPDALHPVGLIILLIGSVLVFWKRADDRWPLVIAWLIAIANTVPQQLLTIERWYGYGRFDVFLILPLAVCVGSLTSWAASMKRLALIALLFAALLWTTPFSFVRFLQQYRSARYQDRIERTVTGGVDVTALPMIVHQLVARADDMIILSPNYAFLDLSVAQGDMTLSQRNGIEQRSLHWNPSASNRPVIIQAPMHGETYQTNISADQETQLLRAAAWAERQPGVERTILGSEQTLIVP